MRTGLEACFWQPVVGDVELGGEVAEDGSRLGQRAAVVHQKGHLGRQYRGGRGTDLIIISYTYWQHVV